MAAAATKQFGNRYHLDRKDSRLVQDGQFVEAALGTFMRALISTAIDMTINRMGPNATHPRIRVFADPRGIITELRVNTTDDVVAGLHWRLSNYSEGPFRSNLERAVRDTARAWLCEDFKQAFIIDTTGIKSISVDAAW